MRFIVDDYIEEEWSSEFEVAWYDFFGDDELGYHPYGQKLWCNL